jgi:hypothetical protein
MENRKINVQYVYPPIPMRCYDYAATFDNYDGAPDSSNRNMIGYGATREEAIAELLRLDEEDV